MEFPFSSIYIVIFTAVPAHVKELAKERTRLQEAAMTATRPEPFIPPTFTPKQERIPRLADYSGLFPDSYWELWPFNGLKQDPDPWISPYQLFRKSLDTAYFDLAEVGVICSWLSEGAPVGAVGASRLPARGENLKGMIANGYEGCDALATWIQQGLIMGPFREAEVPTHKLRISPLNVEIKPNSSMLSLGGRDKS